jgi:hypothetical protein
MGQRLTKISLVLIILSLWSESLELSFLVASAVLVLSFNAKLSRGIFSVVFFMLLLIMIGMMGIFKLQSGAYDFLKDLIYFLRPLVVMLATYFCVRKLDRKVDFFNIIVLCGFGLALIHLLHIGSQIIFIKPSLDKFRGLFGRLNHVEMIALFVVICVKDLPIKKTRFKAVYQFLVLCLAVSFLLYFSRTMLMVFALMVLAYFGYLKLNARGAMAFGVLMILSGAFVLFLANYDPSKERDPGITTRFLEKMKNSYTEAFEPIEFDPYKQDRRELWPRWRAFEANLVLTQVDKEGKWILGKGFGSTVDVGFEIKLDGADIRYLPTVHNGMSYVYMKTGILGILVYMIIIGILYRYYYREEDPSRPVSYNRMLAAIAFYMFTASMVVTGIFKPYEMVTFLIGGVFALKQFDK